MGRVTIATVAAALAFAAPASAAMWPPPSPPPTPVTVQPLHFVKIGKVRAIAYSRTCMARNQRVKITRWLAPVACEQPPRSELLVTEALLAINP